MCLVAERHPLSAEGSLRNSSGERKFGEKVLFVRKESDNLLRRAAGPSLG